MRSPKKLSKEAGEMLATSPANIAVVSNTPDGKLAKAERTAAVIRKPDFDFDSLDR